MGIIILIILGYFLYTHYTQLEQPNKTSYQKKDRPQDVLDQRLARGDISIEEYETIKQTIQ
ncbi:hypothetical protein DES38_103246 [Streptohalobacillus salinus]|uniref:Uncharacterized protein n=1 Tax=Streptohalobacillus salinus TaxID=621096 RepID=A0A2V3WIG4_9BACI|nr:SHOCT domain-containing protein [Streptohalobacillus salinus]PXW92227.1 hypothetical protein DES38_103246 [Streptohalobacillus salinus]